MSRARAVAALGGEQHGFTSGVTWLPGELLDKIMAQTGSADRAQALAAFAASARVDLAFLSLGQSDNYDAVETVHAADVAAVWAVDGVFSRVADRIGWADALRMTASEPGSLAGRLDEALHEGLVEVRDALESGADAVLIGDDLAGPAGPLLAPDYVLDALAPCYHRLALEVNAEARLAIFHSDGDIRTIFPALARAGFSAVHLAGLDQEALAVSARVAVRSGLVVLGGIPVQALPGDARAVGEHAAATALSLGGMIVCDDGGITTLDEVVAFGAAIDAARDAYRHPRA